MLLIGCAKAPAPATARRGTAGVTLAAPPAADDSAAMMAWFERAAAAIDADTSRYTRHALPLVLGAGATGAITAWRDGAIWARMRVETRGDGFQASDDFWLRNGVLLGARLIARRPGRATAVEQVWFRDLHLYRWSDASGDHLNPTARSTQHEVQRLRTRADSLLRRLDRTSP